LVKKSRLWNVAQCPEPSVGVLLTPPRKAKTYMLQHKSIIESADNTGAKKLMVIRVLGGYKKRYAGIGDIVTAVVKEAVPHGTVKKSDIVTVVIVRTRKETRRKDGVYIRFDQNAGVIIDQKNNEPKGTRIFGPVARELRAGGFPKIVSLAPEVL